MPKLCSKILKQAEDTQPFSVLMPGKMCCNMEGKYGITQSYACNRPKGHTGAHIRTWVNGNKIDRTRIMAIQLPGQPGVQIEGPDA